MVDVCCRDRRRRMTLSSMTIHKWFAYIRVFESSRWRTRGYTDICSFIHLETEEMTPYAVVRQWISVLRFKFGANRAIFCGSNFSIVLLCYVWNKNDVIKFNRSKNQVFIVPPLSIAEETKLLQRKPSIIILSLSLSLLELWVCTRASSPPTRQTRVRCCRSKRWRALHSCSLRCDKLRVSRKR